MNQVTQLELAQSTCIDLSVDILCFILDFPHRLVMSEQPTQVTAFAWLIVVQERTKLVAQIKSVLSLLQLQQIRGIYPSFQIDFILCPQASNAVKVLKRKEPLKQSRHVRQFAQSFQTTKDQVSERPNILDWILQAIVLSDKGWIGQKEAVKQLCFLLFLQKVHRVDRLHLLEVQSMQKAASQANLDTVLVIKTFSLFLYHRLGNLVNVCCEKQATLSHRLLAEQDMVLWEVLNHIFAIEAEVLA